MVILSVVLALGVCYNAVVAYALAQTSAGAIPLRDKQQTGAVEVRSWFGVCRLIMLLLLLLSMICI